MSVRSRLRAGVVLAAALLAVEAASAAAASTRACPSDGARSARCLRVQVPLDRSGVLPGTIGLHVRMLSPLSGSAGETILALAGGPGQAAVPLLSAFQVSLPGSVLSSRRLVTFDQRGTGHSGRLRCPGLGRAVGAMGGSVDALERAVAGCAARLGPARAHYTTADSVEDVEAVRSALGIDQLVLYGTSYGTKVALDYAAAHPEHVSRLLLDSTLLPEGSDPFERATIASVPRVMRAVCADHGCRFTHDAGADTVALARRLASGPLLGRFVDGRGRARSRAVRQVDLLRLLLTSDASPLERSLLPAAVRAARDGDPALLLRLIAIPTSAFEAEGGDSDAVLVATRCEDGGVPWPVGTPVAQRRAAVGAALAALPPEQLAPFDAGSIRRIGFADLCDGWPEAPIPQPHLPLPDVPTLILSGDVDLRTPRSYALALAARMPRAQVVAVPQMGHSVLGSDPGHCASDAVNDFFAARPPRACENPDRDAYLVPAGVPIRSLRDLRPHPGLPPRVGRTIAAVRESFYFMGRTLVLELFPRLFSADPHTKAFRLGGLRGGSLTFTRRGMMLRRYSVVRGVTLNARANDTGDDEQPLVVRIAGRAAAHGVLRAGDTWIVGQLDGHRVRVRARQPESGSLLARAARATPPGAEPAERVLPVLPPPLRALLGWR
jgi:pimeloyl-ACP methyl ester carboxylesterase